MFRSALAGGLHLDMEALAYEIMALRVGTAPLVDSGRSQTWDHEMAQHEQFSEQSHLDIGAHFLTRGLPGRLPGADRRRHGLPWVATLDNNRFYDIAAERREDTLMRRWRSQVQHLTVPQAPVPHLQAIQVGRLLAALLDGDAY